MLRSKIHNLGPQVLLHSRGCWFVHSSERMYASVAGVYILYVAYEAFLPLGY